MKNLSLSLLLAGSLLFSGGASVRADVTDYQVTGPILSMTDTVITVQKGKEKWDIAKDANTKGATDLKVGDKVTIHYTMTATTIESKPAGGAKAKKEAAAPGAPTGAKPAAEAAPGASPASR